MQPSAGESGNSRRTVFRSLATKFSVFTATLVFWVVATLLAYNLRQDNFDVSKGLLVFVVVLLVAGAISRFTIRLLIRPLRLLQAGITSVRNGRLEPLQVSQTSDEIEYLGESFNGMIQALTQAQDEVRQHQALLEQRIQQRTEELEATLRRAEATSGAKSEFLAGLSQELRTPIGAVIEMLEATLAGSLSTEQTENLKTAQRCAESLLRLLDQSLDLSKVEAGKIALERIPFDLHVLLSDSVCEAKPLAARKDVAIECSISPNVPAQVVGDPLRIRQIVSNLLGNAINFAEQGNVALIADSVVDPDSNVKLMLCVRNSNCIDGSQGGSGVGWAITRKLVELHSGEVRVDCEPGRATEYHVTLGTGITAGGPPAAMPARSEIAALARSVSERARLLVVEDNLVNQKVVLAILHKRGFDVELANDGREALRKLEESDFDAVLMDVQMPVLDGLETTRIIRQDPRWSDLPIIAMTAHAMSGDRELCLQAGMNGYISKPLHPSDLVNLVRQFIRARV